MNQLVIFYSASMGGGLSGGDERLLSLLACWKKEGHDIELLVTEPYFQHAVIERGIQLHRILVTREAEGNLIRTYFVRTHDIIQQTKGLEKGPLVFYSASSFTPDVVPAAHLRKKNRNSRWCAMVQHIIRDYRGRPGNRLWNYGAYKEQQYCLGLMKKYADRVFAIGEEIRDYLISAGFDKRKVISVENGVDPDDFAECFVDNSVAVSDPVGENHKIYDGIYVGRLVPEKGTFDLPGIWKEVLSSHKGAKLCVVGGAGDPEMVEKLKGSFSRNGIMDEVTFTGPLSHDEVLTELSKAKLLIFPSYSESWGLVICEAMGMGLACVTYDVPAFRTIYRGINQAAPMHDQKKAAEIVSDLLDHPEKAQELGRRGRELVLSEYVWPVIAGKEWKLLETCGEENGKVVGESNT